MNNSSLAFLASDDIKAVKCVFQDTRNWDGGFDTDHYSGRRNSKVNLDKFKEYTYKTTLDLAEDDLVLVQCAGDSNHFGMCVVKVVETNVEIDLSSDIQFKWVVGKVDTSEFEKTMKAEKELIKEVRRLELKNRKGKLREVLGIAGETFSLTHFKDKVKD